MRLSKRIARTMSAWIMAGLVLVSFPALAQSEAAEADSAQAGASQPDSAQAGVSHADSLQDDAVPADVIDEALSAAVQAAQDAPTWHGGEHWNSLALTTGLTTIAFRDEALSPLRRGGISPQLAVTLDSFTPERIDRFFVSWTRGSDAEWDWLYLDASWFYSKRVLERARWDLFVGYDWENKIATRTYVETTAWQAQSTFGPGIGFRYRLLEREHALLLEARASTPLLGAAGRSGHASVLQEPGLTLRDFFFAAPHNLQGLSLDCSLLWIRPNGGDLRVELETWFRRTSIRHEAVDAASTLSVSWFWRL